MTIRDRLTSNIARKLVNDAAAGSPYAMHLISRELRRQPLGVEKHFLLAPETFFVQVCQSIFVCRNPARTLVHLQNACQEVPNIEECALGLCGLAIMRSVYKRDWQSAEVAFRAARDRAQEAPIPLLLEAVAGLKERFLLLPRGGDGTRSCGSSSDLLWMANRAEEHFCAGRFREAVDATTFLEGNFPKCGWVRTLRLRSLIVAGKLEAAQSLLFQSELGVIAAGDGLAWDNVLNGLLTKWGNNIPKGDSKDHVPQHFRMPLYFQGLTRMFRGDRGGGLSQLDRAAQLGEPAALMRNFDPVARYGPGLAGATACIRLDGMGPPTLSRHLEKAG